MAGYRAVRIQLGAPPDSDPANPYMEVVGAVGDVRQQPDADARSEMYVPGGSSDPPFI